MKLLGRGHGEFLLELELKLVLELICRARAQC